MHHELRMGEHCASAKRTEQRLPRHVRSVRLNPAFRTKYWRDGDSKSANRGCDSDSPLELGKTTVCQTVALDFAVCAYDILPL